MGKEKSDALGDMLGDTLGDTPHERAGTYDR
jgi:hypothetical protein